MNNSRDKGVLIGLYLSKFDVEGLNYLGFKGFIEAYNTLGYASSNKPASIKNYRDEFDPLFPNLRIGRKSRKVRKYCMDIYDKYCNLTLEEFAVLLKFEIQISKETNNLIKNGNQRNIQENTFAKRLLTGQAAEKYFLENYCYIPEFNGYEVGAIQIVAKRPLRSRMVRCAS